MSLYSTNNYYELIDKMNRKLLNSFNSKALQKLRKFVPCLTNFATKL